MKERIIEFLKAENKSSAQFADEIGVQPSGISHILSGRNNPSLDFILNMLEKYKYLSTDWLLFGRGAMYIEAGMTDLFSVSPGNDHFLRVDPENNIQREETLPKPLNRKDEDGLQKEGSAEENTEKEVVVEKIVWFYKNNRFREFYPGK
jgi:transcriptional regulator with XRE-family HTH domain